MNQSFVLGVVGVGVRHWQETFNYPDKPVISQWGTPVPEQQGGLPEITQS